MIEESPASITVLLKKVATSRVRVISGTFDHLSSVIKAKNHESAEK
jgi:hypothetical protein